jgi:hypothetical protein
MKHVDVIERMKQTLQGQLVLAPLTRVKRNVGGWLGTVQKYDCSVGGFPVRYDGGMWELVGIDDVTVLQPKVPRVRKRARPATMSR